MKIAVSKKRQVATCADNKKQILSAEKPIGLAATPFWGLCRQHI